MTTKDWEVWNEELADKLISEWADPYAKRGRHHELLYRMATLVGNGSVLDAGCGTGHIYARMMEQKEQEIDYLGVDSSDAMLAKARGFFPEAEHRFIKGDLYDLEGIEPRDHAVMVSIMVHLPDPLIDVMREVWSKVKKTFIFDHKIGKKHVGQTPGYSGDKDKYLIRRQDTLESIFTMIGKLGNVGKVEHMFFDGGSHIFRVTKGVLQPAPRDFDNWILRK